MLQMNSCSEASVLFITGQWSFNYLLLNLGVVIDSFLCLNF